MEFIILIRSYFTTRNNQESGKRANERKFEVQTALDELRIPSSLSLSRVLRARTQVVHLSVICENLATAGRVRGGTNLPAESSEFRGKVGSIGDADPDRLAPTLRRNLFRRSNRGRPLFTVAMSCQRFAGNLPLFSFIPPNTYIREDIPYRSIVAITISIEKLKLTQPLLTRVSLFSLWKNRSIFRSFP